jgi:hypothetical protein
VSLDLTCPVGLFFSKEAVLPIHASLRKNGAPPRNRIGKNHWNLKPAALPICVVVHVKSNLGGRGEIRTRNEQYVRQLLKLLAGPIRRRAHTF